MVVGRHGVLTPDQARERARAALADVAAGNDPQGAKAERRGELTVAELCDLYMAEGTATKKASTLALDRIRIDRHIKPRLGKMKVSDVTRADLERLMVDVGSGKIRGEATPHIRGGKGAASRTIGFLGGIFTFAQGRGLVPLNPARGVKRYQDTRRERFLSPAEMARLGDVLSAMEDGGGDARHVAIIRLLALTGARKNEIAHLRWSEVDSHEEVLRLADSKTGAKVIPLGAAAIQVIDDWRTRQAGDNSPYLFHDHRDPEKPVGNLDWAWVGMRERAGLSGVRIHDLRHSFASAGLRSGQGLAIIGKLLGHGHVVTTARYAHLADDPVKAAAHRISDVVSAEMTGRSADVEQLRRTAG